MFPREWRAKPREDVDTSMIGRIWRRVMQIRGSAGVDLMARAQVRAHREPCGPRQWIPPAREGGRSWDRACDGPSIFSFFTFSSNLSRALLVNAQEEIFEEVCVFTRYYFDRLSR